MDDRLDYVLGHRLSMKNGIFFRICGSWYRLRGGNMHFVNDVKEHTALNNRMRELESEYFKNDGYV